MGRLEGKVAFITGAARGQGRSHAIRLAEEGAAIIAVDICEQISTVFYPLATKADLEETQRLVEDADGRILTAVADVRDRARLQAAYDAGVAEFGPADIVLPNAGIMPVIGEGERVQAWHDGVDTLLTGVWHTLEITIPGMIERGPGRRDHHHQLHRRPQRHRANAEYGAFVERFPEIAGSPLYQNPMPVQLIEPVDVSNAIVYLASDDARYVTGVTFPVDAGYLNRGPALTDVQG